MTQLSVMRTKIADEITRSDLTSQITAAINDAIKLWEAERFHFNEKRYLINTVPSQEYYDIVSPTLLTSAGAAVATGEEPIEIDSITCTVSSFPYPLTPRTQQWFDLNQSLPTQYTGQPDSYTIYGNQLRLFPIPDSAGSGVGGAYPIRISCHARLGPNPLTADADTNAWMTEGEMLIREEAKAILYAFPLLEPELSTLAQNRRDAAYASLKRKMNAKANTGSIAPWSL
jgi:hypothetical protein